MKHFFSKYPLDPNEGHALDMIYHKCRHLLDVYERGAEYLPYLEELQEMIEHFIEVQELGQYQQHKPQYHYSHQYTGGQMEGMGGGSMMEEEGYPQAHQQSSGSSGGSSGGSGGSSGRGGGRGSSGGRGRR